MQMEWLSSPVAHKHWRYSPEPRQQFDGGELSTEWSNIGDRSWMGGYQMLRITIVFLMGLVMQAASGEELISVDIDRLREIALDAALLDHPELLPGDLVDGHNGMINIICIPKLWGDRCQAQFSFDIVSTTTKNVKRDGDKCYEETNTKHVSVTVLPDGSVMDINNSSSRSSSKSIDCPADIDDKELTGL